MDTDFVKIPFGAAVLVCPPFFSLPLSALLVNSRLTFEFLFRPCDVLHRHIQSLSMTIAFFNLLPLPQLDGSAILEAILLLMSLIPSPADSLAQFDLDSLESGSLLISGRNLRHSALLQSFTFVSRWLPTIEINDRRTVEWMRLVGHWTTGMAVILLSSSIAAEAVRLHV